MRQSKEVKFKTLAELFNQAKTQNLQIPSISYLLDKWLINQGEEGLTFEEWVNIGYCHAAGHSLETAVGMALENRHGCLNEK